VLVKNEYPILSDKAVKGFLPLVSMYLCENGNSAVAVMKATY
jgi:hypothetical protein